tara:strand:+ start:155 stop:1156 length:1002 start_codon:yes stop_codon:yes gene_type:complete
MKKKLLLPLIILSIVLVSCSKEISINDLESKDSVAYDRLTNEPYNGIAYLDFYDGSQRMKGEYVSGIKSGMWQYFIQGSSSKYYELQFENGDIISAQYQDRGRKWAGTPMLYTENDTTIRTGIFLLQQMSEGQELYNFNSPPDIFLQLFQNISEGEITRWHSNGEIYSNGQFINGNRVGEHNWYYESGKRKERQFFDSGKRIATTTQWYENGKKYAEGNYKKGQLSGKLTWWYENGQKKEEANFAVGDRDGLAYWWYPNGNKKAFADVSRKMGKVTLFSPDGRTTNPLEVKDNIIICNSGEALFNMERLSKREAPPIGDGTCDCGDCSDEPKA